MKKLYLIRHARPDFPEGERLCLGLTDLPLGEEGRRQARILGEKFSSVPLGGVYCSYLSRSLETAQCLAPEPEIIIGLEEMSAGAWDGMAVSDIKEQFPELYEERIKDLSVPIPGAEDIYMAQERFEAALRELMDACPGDAAVVSHGTVIQSFICSVLNEEPSEARRHQLGYCEGFTIEYDGEFRLISEALPFKEK